MLLNVLLTLFVLEYLVRPRLSFTSDGGVNVAYGVKNRITKNLIK